jgi:hypothetical protein
MGWKSTVDITRAEAISLIMSQLLLLNDKTDSELEDMLYDMNFGDDLNLPYYGHNFNVTDYIEE